MGKYHGRFRFEEFSNHRAIMTQGSFSPDVGSAALRTSVSRPNGLAARKTAGFPRSLVSPDKAGMGLCWPR